MRLGTVFYVPGVLLLPRQAKRLSALGADDFCPSVILQAARLAPPELRPLTDVLLSLCSGNTHGLIDHGLVPLLKPLVDSLDCGYVDWAGGHLTGLDWMVTGGE